MFDQHLLYSQFATATLTSSSPSSLYSLLCVIKNKYKKWSCYSYKHKVVHTYSSTSILIDPLLSIFSSSAITVCSWSMVIITERSSKPLYHLIRSLDDVGSSAERCCCTIYLPGLSGSRRVVESVKVVQTSCSENVRTFAMVVWSLLPRTQWSCACSWWCRSACAPFFLLLDHLKTPLQFCFVRFDHSPDHQGTEHLLDSSSLVIYSIPPAHLLPFHTIQSQEDRSNYQVFAATELRGQSKMYARFWICILIGDCSCWHNRSKQTGRCG